MRKSVGDLARVRGLWGVLIGCCLAAATPASAALIGGADIVPTTSVSYCVECLFPRVWLISEITDGVTADAPPLFNGFAGATGVIGTIHLDLVGTFNLNSFLLWNDINVVHEGVGTFRLDFFDEANVLISASSVLAAPVGDLAAGQYDFATVFGVGSVDLVVLSNLASVNGERIEIREVAFEGEAAVPEPGTLGLMALGLAGLGLMRRRPRAS